MLSAVRLSRLVVCVNLLNENSWESIEMLTESSD